MKRFIIALFLAALAPVALALPGIDLSVGPYLGIYQPSLKTLNDQVLVWNHHPELGATATYGVEFKVGFPMGLGGGIGLGYWSKSSSWQDDYSVLGIPNYADVKLTASAPMLDLSAHYSLPVVPALLKARLGAMMTMAWGKLDITNDHTHLNGSAQQVTDHRYVIAKGSGTAFGLLAGLDLVAIPKVTIGLEAGYRAGKIDKLTIKESSDPADVNTVYQYYDHTTNQLLTLPVELSGMHLKLSARYHF